MTVGRSLFKVEMVAEKEEEDKEKSNRSKRKKRKVDTKTKTKKKCQKAATKSDKKETILADKRQKTNLLVFLSFSFNVFFPLQ